MTRKARACQSNRHGTTCDPGTSTSTMTCFLLLLALLVVLVDGQRSILNLGQRFRKQVASDDRFQGMVWRDSWRRLSDVVVRYPVHWNRLLAVLVSLVVVLWSLGSNRDDDDDDIVIKNDHIEAMGGLSQVDLAFEGFQLTLQTKQGPRVLMDGSIRGRARPGRLLAIMGPSGAGKSTLLHALAGRIKHSSKLELEGRRYVNGELVAGDSQLPAAFVEQDVNFFPHMTVRETLRFRVELKLGSQLSKAAQEAIVNDLLDELGLRKSADTIVGDSKIRGISGGERKRLSIAVEMISSPSAIFLDEPTSGLDSTAATSLVTTLRALADAGKTVVAVIHQPSQHVFAKFDDVLLVSEGKQMYFGERQMVRYYMERLGCEAESAEMGTAEHILDCITRSPIEDESEADANERVDRLAEIAREDTIDLGPRHNGKRLRHFGSGHGGPRANIFIQFKLLLRRSFREITRGKTALMVKAFQQVTLALIYGGIYGLGDDQASIQDRFGLLSLIAIGSSNMAVAQTIRSFPKEKAIVENELASKMYRTLPYFIGKALSEVPLVGLMNALFGTILYRLTGLSRQAGKFGRFLGLLATHGLVSQAVGLVIGAISPNSDVALAIFPAVLVLNIIFDGKNISEENTPKILRWIPKVGLIRWGFEGLAVNEFDGLAFVGGGPRRGPVAKTGADALARFGLGANTVGDVVKAQSIITASCWALSYLGLTLTRQKFLIMKLPENDEEDEKVKQS